MRLGRGLVVGALFAGFAFGSAAAAETPGENCIATGKVCVEAGGTRLVDGIPVTRDCWSWRETFACVTPDTESVNGCSTLQNDAEVKGPGKCVLKESVCSDEVAGEDGTRVCLATKETWACETKIELPPVNAEWTHTTSETEETVDESACESLIGRSDCSKGELKCTESGCERIFYCGAKNATGCSDLAAAGCSVTQEPACDPETDPTSGRLHEAKVEK